MNEYPLSQLGPRERQVMEAVFRLGSASARDVHGAIENAPSYSTVRVLLGRLEKRGYVRHHRRGVRYIYETRLSTDRTRRAALEQMVDTFFDGSPEAAALALLGNSQVDLPADVKRELEAEIERVRNEGR